MLAISQSLRKTHLFLSISPLMINLTPLPGRKPKEPTNKNQQEYLGNSTWSFSHHGSWACPSPSLEDAGAYYDYCLNIELSPQNYISRCEAEWYIYPWGSRTHSQWKTSCQVISPCQCNRMKVFLFCFVSFSNINFKRSLFDWFVAAWRLRWPVPTYYPLKHLYGK